jgi:glycosyltransferase involved in cell wall biosynthesis
MVSLEVGLFSYNEGRNVQRTLDSIAEQLRGTDFQIVLLDDSTEPASLEIIREVREQHPEVIVLSSPLRRGRVRCANEVANHFLRGSRDFLILANSDLQISPGCLESLKISLLKGGDLVATTSQALAGRNLFERTLGLMRQPTESSDLAGVSTLPLIGHLAGLSRRATKAVFPLTEDGSAEDLLALGRALRNNLRCVVDPMAVVRYRLSANIDDYLSSSRRVFGMERAFRQSEAELSKLVKAGTHVAWAPQVIVNTIRKDPIAALLLPYTLVLRTAARLSMVRTPSPIWKTEQTTKDVD